MSLLRSIPALLAGAALLVLGLLFSVVVLVIIAVLGLGVWAWLWWKTRKLRRAAPDAAGATPAGGQVFEGEAVVVEEERVVENLLPHSPRPGDQT